MHPDFRRLRTNRVVIFATLVVTLTAPLRVVAQDAAETRPVAGATRTVASDFSYVSFSGGVSPWRLASVSASRRTTSGSLIARLNYADRFGTQGIQLEADAYPRLGKKVYLYLNAGYSSTTIFPDWRFGGEAFTSLPAAWEASVGFRQLRFGGAPVTLVTGAVGKYIGNYWLSLRPYLRQKPGGTSASVGLTARRYFEDGEHWVGATASYGSSPTDRITPDAVERTKALSMSLNGSTGLTRRLLGTWTLGRDREELSPGRTRDSFTLSAGLRFTF